MFVLPAALRLANHEKANLARKKISAACMSRPMIDIKPPMPPKNPWPIKRPKRPAPSRPPARPPMKLRPNEEPAKPGCVPKPPFIFWLGRGVTLRSKGEAAPGMVRVEGGADHVRAPLLPKLPPPPIRASAMAGARARRPARASIFSDPRFNAKNRNMIVSSLKRQECLE